MATQDFTPEKKAQIALEALIGELTRTTTSKDVGDKYGTSTRAVNTWKEQGLQAFKDSFIEQETEAIPSINREDISNNIAKLLGVNPSTSSNAQSQNSKPIGEVIEKIIQWNDGDNESKIYISESLVTKLSGHSVSQVRNYFEENQSDINSHNKKYNLDSNSNKKLRGFDYAGALGL